MAICSFIFGLCSFRSNGNVQASKQMERAHIVASHFEVSSVRFRKYLSIEDSERFYAEFFLIDGEFENEAN